MRRFLSFLIYLFIGLPTALGTLFWIGLGPAIGNRDFYKNALTDDRLYAIVAAADPASGDGTVTRDGYTFDEGALFAAAQAALPVAETKAFTIRAIDEAFDSAAPGGDASIDLDLVPLKKAVAARIDAATDAYVAVLPRRDAVPQTGDLSFLPSSATEKTGRSAARTGLLAFLNEAPDKVSEPVVRDGGKAVATRGFLGVAPFGSSPFTLGIFSLLAIGTSAALGAGTMSRRLVLGGKRILVPSVIAIVAGGLLYLPGGLFLKGVIPSEASGFLSAGTISAMGGWLTHVFGPMARSLFIAGISGASLGAMLSASRRIFEAREQSYEE